MQAEKWCKMNGSSQFGSSMEKERVQSKLELIRKKSVRIVRVLVCDARNRCFKLVGCDRKLDWIVENGDAFDEFRLFLARNVANSL